MVRSFEQARTEEEGEAALESPGPSLETPMDVVEGALPRRNPRELPPHAHSHTPAVSPPAAPLRTDVPGRPNALVAAVERVIAVTDADVEPSGGRGLGEELTDGLLVRAFDGLEAGLSASA